MVVTVVVISVNGKKKVKLGMKRKSYTLLIKKLPGSPPQKKKKIIQSLIREHLVLYREENNGDINSWSLLRNSCVYCTYFIFTYNILEIENIRYDIPLGKVHMVLRFDHV